MVYKNASLHTGDLHPDEPCWRLQEYDEEVPNVGHMRVQVVHVMRGQKLYEFWCPLGLSMEFHALPIDIQGGVIDDVSGRIRIFHSVGDLMEIAENERGKPLTDGTIEHMETAAETMLADLDAAAHETSMLLTNRSVFGSSHVKVRG